MLEDFNWFDEDAWCHSSIPPSYWDSDRGTPVSDVIEIALIFQKETGIKADTVLLPKHIFDLIRTHKDTVARVALPEDEPRVVNRNILAQLLDLDVKIIEEAFAWRKDPEMLKKSSELNALIIYDSNLTVANRRQSGVLCTHLRRF